MIKSKSGFSLIEVMMAVSLIAIAVYLIPQFLSIYNPRELTVGRVCESHAQSIIAAVQEETTHRNLVQWLETPTKRSASTRPTFTATRALPNVTDYWAPSANFYTSEAPISASAGARLQNAALIQGSLRTLSAIYNQNSSVRCSYAAYTPLTSDIPLPSALAVYNTAGNPVTTTISISPYRTTTNQDLCGTTINLFPVPTGISASEMVNVFTARSGNTNISDVEASDYSTPRAPTYNDAAMDPYRIANVSNGEANLGFRLRVRVSYVADGESKVCEVSQNFEYPMDKTPPIQPNDVVITENTSLSPSQLNCAAVSNKQVSLRIGYLQSPAAPPERGTVLLCRDLSYAQNRFPNYNTTGFNNPTGPTSTTTHFSGACINQAGLSSAPTSLNGLSPYPRQRSTTAPEDDNPANHRLWDQAYRDFTIRDNFWQPCDKLRLCGATAASVTLNNELSVTLQYTTVPVGCVINFEVVGVDAAGNRSNPAVIPTAPARPARGITPTVSIAGIEEGNIVFPPTCGNSTTCTSANGTCTSVTKATYSQYYMGSATDNGYYVARRGVFCRPTANSTDDGNLTASQTQANATLHWSTNTVGGVNWRTVFPNGYYTCRGAFGGTGGAGGSGSNGCCWDPPGSTTCTPYN